MRIIMKTEGGQSCAAQVKIEEPVYNSYNQRQGQVKYQHNPHDKDQIFSRESQANWNINEDHSNFDNRSMKSIVSTSTNRSKRAPTVDDLFKAIVTLRNKLPNKSLQQTIIRLHQCINHKKQSDSMSNASRRSKNYEPSVCSRIDDFDDSKSFGGTFTFDQNFYESMKDQSKRTESMDLKQHQSFPMKKSKQNQEQQYIRDPRYDELPQAGTNYIYQPKEQEVVIEYLQEKSRKVNFINEEEESRYIERRVMANSFIERGYGVSQCRKEIQAQNLTIQMHRNTYKTLAGSVIILAFRKLQSFIANECGKTLKYLDRWQMRSICTTMLNCRTNMEPQQMETLFKYIRASYGLADVNIGQVESVKLYLAILKNIHGKNVTMQSLERIGEIQQKKNMQLTHDYLNRKKLKRQQRLERLRKLRLQIKQQKRIDSEKRKKETYEILNQIELNNVNIKIQAQLEAEKDRETNEHNNTEVTSENQREHSVSQMSASQLDPSDLKQQSGWLEEYDSEFVRIYLEDKNILNSITILQERHEELVNWNVELFQKKFCKILKKSVKQVQIQSQMAGEQGMPVLNKLDKDQMRKLLYSPSAQNIREQLLTYYLLEQPQLQMLIEVVAHTNIFFYGLASGQRKRGRGRPPNSVRREAQKRESSVFGSQERSCYAQPHDGIYLEEDLCLQQEQLRRTIQEYDPSCEDDIELEINLDDLRLDLDQPQPDQSNASNFTEVKIESQTSEML